VKISDFIIPVFMILIFVYAGFFKRVNTYQSFTAGAKAAIKLSVDILPFIATILIAIQLFTRSGLLDILCSALQPVFSLFGIPTELSAFIILKPFSGSGSITLFNDIVTKFGADSYITRVASVIAGSSETVFYISAVYFSKTKIKNLSFAIPVALFCTFLSAMLASLVCLII
jgi:spore maturation protein B